MVFSNLDNDFALGLIALEILVSFDDVFPVKDLVNKDLESAIVFGKVIQYSMLVDFIAQTGLVLQRAGTKVGAFNL